MTQTTNETGPIYNVPLIDVLPLNYKNGERGMLQQMPSRYDLEGVGKVRHVGFLRVVSAYEVLLNHWHEQRELIDRYERALASLNWKLGDAENGIGLVMIESESDL